MFFKFRPITFLKLSHNDHKSKPVNKPEANKLTFIAVSYSVEVDIIVVITKEHETEPGIKRVNGHNKKNTNNPTLLIRAGIVPKVQVDLKQRFT